MIKEIFDAEFIIFMMLVCHKIYDCTEYKHKMSKMECKE